MNLFIMIGISGSGKSTRAKEIADGFDNKISIHSSDSVRKEIYGDENCQKDHNRVFEIMRERTLRDLRKGKHVIYDATNLNRKRRISLIKEIKGKFSDIKVIGELVLLPPEICIKRRAMSDRIVPENVILRQLTQFQVPYYNEGFDIIEEIYCGNKDDLEDYFSKIYVRALKCQHDNPHHNDSILYHCLKVEDNMTFSNIGLFHDLGKIYVKHFDSEGIAHYYNHANVSAYLYLLNKDDKSNCDGVLQEALAIEYHMKQFDYNNKENFENWKNTLPYHTLAVLEELWYADKQDSLSIDK